MAQDKGQSRDKAGAGGGQGGTIPNRDRRRQPAVIEGEALKTPAGESDAAASTTPAASDDVGKPALDENAPKPGPVSEDLPSPPPPAPGETVRPGSSPDTVAATNETPEPAETAQDRQAGSDDSRTRVENASTPKDRLDGPPPPPPSARRGSALTPLAALAALLLAGASLYVALTRQSPVVSQADLSALSDRLGTLDKQIAAIEAKIPRPVDLAPIQTRLDAIESTATSARDEAARLLANRPANEPRVDLGPIEKRLAALEAKPAPKFDTGPIDERIAGLQSKIDKLADALEAPKTAVRATQDPSVTGTPPGDAAALAVVAESLRQKLERGAPFKTELAALEKLGAPAGRLAPLRGLADKGAASAEALLRSFRQVSSSVARADEKPSDDTFLGRLTGKAASLVRVRPVGEPTGEDPAALAGRIESALRRGDVSDAVALWNRLPDSAKKVSSDWAARARQRAEADTSVRQIIDGAVERLSRTQ